MSRARGLDLQNALARYLKGWWPNAESAGAGRPGTDVLGTPGVVWENKTAKKFDPFAFVRQARQHAEGKDCECPRPESCEHMMPLSVVVYWPDRVGERSAPFTLAIMTLNDLIGLLKEAGYAPGKVERDE